MDGDQDRFPLDKKAMEHIISDYTRRGRESENWSGPLEVFAERQLRKR